MDTGSIIRNAIGVAKKDDPHSKDYYIGEDGLPICRKCGEHLQTYFEWQGKKILVSCLCKCQQEKIARQDEQASLKEKVRLCKEANFSDKKLSSWNFTTDDLQNVQISKAMKNYVANWANVKKQGKGLILYGDPGTGKTFFAACIVNALTEKGVPCLMTNFARLTNSLWAINEKQAYLDNLNKYSLLVVDDLAAERDTEYMNEMVFQVIDARYRSGLPLIITTNLTARDLKCPKTTNKQRVYSRILEMCYPVEVKGERRGKKIDMSYGDMQQILFGKGERE